MSKLFFIDACHSGATGDDVFALQTPGTSINNLASEQSGLNIITSCRANEYSYEDDNWRNGAFTAALVKTFEQFAQGKTGLDKNDDKQLDVQELFQYIQTQVPQLVQQKRPKVQTSQVPIMMLAQPTQPIVLFELPKQ
ncbi:MAG: caspase family protein [Saprospiraceae bacterium]|nr:caspase family protein [Saprospiraceae bacterium]